MAKKIANFFRADSSIDYEKELKYEPVFDYFMSPTDDNREGLQDEDDNCEELQDEHDNREGLQGDLDNQGDIEGVRVVGSGEIRYTGYMDDTIGDYGSMFGVVATPTVSSISSVDRAPERFSLMKETENDEDNSGGLIGEADHQIEAPAQQTFSSSSSDTPEETSRASLEKPVVLPEGISYERDNDHQKLVAVMGREFDLPLQVAENLNEVYGRLHRQENEVKFLGYICKRQDLLMGRIHDSDVQRHDLVMMCYNASEARIMLTGEDGFYSKLLTQVYSLLGTNKAVFVIIKYHSLVVDTDTLIPESLNKRLSRQPELEECLSNRQVMSWTDKPTGVHIDRLIELAHVIGTPRKYNCTIL